MALRLLSLLAILAGGGLLAVAVVTGQAEVGLLLVVPFVVGSGPLPLVGTLLLFLGMVGFFVGTARRVTSPRGRARREMSLSDAEEPRTEGGGLIMIGPIPIVVGSDRRTALLAALGGILVLLGLILAWLLAG